MKHSHYTFLQYVLAAFFIVAGVSKIFMFETMVGYVASTNMFLPRITLGIVMVTEIVAGVGLLFSTSVKWSSFALGILMILIILFVNLSIFSAPFANAGMSGTPGLMGLFSNLVLLAAFWGLFQSN